MVCIGYLFGIFISFLLPLNEDASMIVQSTRIIKHFDLCFGGSLNCFVNSIIVRSVSVDF